MRDESTTESSRILPPASDGVPSWWRRNLAWLVPVAVLIFLLAVTSIVFTFWRTDQVAVRPGSVEEVPSRVTVSGAEFYPPESEISLVTVLVSQRLTIWQRIDAEFESGVQESSGIHRRRHPAPASSTNRMGEPQHTASLWRFEPLGLRGCTRNPWGSPSCAGP